MPEFSIIVPIYKVEKYLEICIDSIIGQSFCNFELILVDDGSPDTCGEICDRYSSSDTRVKVVHKENGGLSSARNAGLDIATGKYVIFIDSDDFWDDASALEHIHINLSSIVRKPYVLFFCVGYNDELDQTLEFAKNLANEKNMELLYLSNQDIWYKHRELHHCGAASPCEFLGYIRNASYVVTNSFHATAFSIIFHREFYSEIGLKRNGRIKNILNLTGLQDHAINRGINKENTFKGKIDWSKVDVRLNLEKEKSYKFLRSVVDLIEK